jgi:hypothetical protein
MDTLTIVGGNINASCAADGAYGSEIGTGYEFSTITNLTIVGGDITASSTGTTSSYGSGIGTGFV